ncbi:MAG: NAD(P)-dependent oxidoreductase [Limnothrix sp. RL_2_0]|nr:NAD(P)-dependent oxidoreductase [Limnothrix sp. RL_2_0]
MKISVFGMGLMGAPIAMKLAQSRFSVTVYNRTAEKLEPFKKLGLGTTSVANEAIAASDYLLLTLSDFSAINAVLFSGTSSDLIGKTIIQMGTIAPKESKILEKKITELGGQYLEAPVLGSIPQAKSGTLLVMAGGTEMLFSECLPILQVLGETPTYIGKIGSAAALKLALNQLIASLTAGFSLSLGLIQREGVDLEKFMTILRASALYAPTFDKKLQRMGDRQFENPNFPTKHLLKDTNLFLQAAEDAELNAGGLIGIRNIIEQAIANQLAELDYSAIFEIIAPATEP